LLRAMNLHLWWCLVRTARNRKGAGRSLSPLHLPESIFAALGVQLAAALLEKLPFGAG
jgi:hypothetical protein